MENLNLNTKINTEKFKNEFNFTHSINFDTKIGDIVPFFNLEVIPGDVINLNYKIFSKSAPLISPLFNYVDHDIRFFYIPHRINFSKFNEWLIYNSTDEGSNIPQIRLNRTETVKFLNNWKKVLDAFGISADIYEINKMNLLLWRSYNKIFYYYYLNSNIFDQGDLNKIANWATLDDDTIYYNVDDFLKKDGNFNPRENPEFNGFHIAFTKDKFVSQIKNISNFDAMQVGNLINEMWKNIALQKHYNRIQITLNKFKNYIYNLFGIELNYTNEPIYIGGQNDKFFINEIYATTENDNQPLGAFAGKAESLNNNDINFIVPEYGYIVGVQTITPEIHRAQTLNKSMLKTHQLDFYNPDIDGKFIDTITKRYIDSRVIPQYDEIIGMTEPYFEYKTIYNKVFGEMARNALNWNFTDHWPTRDLFDLNFNNVYHYLSFENHNNNATNFWRLLSEYVFAVPTEPHFLNRCDINLLLKRNIKKFEF